MDVVNSESTGSNRRLNENQMVESGKEIWFEDMERDRMIRVMLLDSLEVKMKRESDSDILSDIEEFKWDIIDYQKDFIWI